MGVVIGDGDGRRRRDLDVRRWSFGGRRKFVHLWNGDRKRRAN